MSRRVWWFLSISTLVAACTASTNEATTSTDDVSTTSSTREFVAGDLPGQLAIIDPDGNVKVTDPDGSNPRQLTDDAGDLVLYTQPIWSPTPGVVAWGQASERGVGVALTNVTDDDRSFVATNGLPFYMSFSPTGEHLATLNNGQRGLDFLIIDTDNATVTAFDQGSPYYFSWRPDGDRLAVHEGETRFETIDPLQGDRVSMGLTGRGYLSPFWGPEGILHIVDETLVTHTVDGETVSIATVRDFTPFVVNPQGTHVALQTTGGPRAISVNLNATESLPRDSLVVINIETGDFETVLTEPTVGFFWSPDGRSLLALQPGESGLRPVVWSVDGELTDFAQFRPSTLWTRDVLPFFPQYAQSLRIWSPDSQAFAYPTEDAVFVQHLKEPEPTRVSEGTWVAWSLQ